MACRKSRSASVVPFFQGGHCRGRRGHHDCRRVPKKAFCSAAARPTPRPCFAGAPSKGTRARRKQTAPVVRSQKSTQVMVKNPLHLECYPDTDPLCCCEYTNVQGERAHLCGLLCDCNEVDEAFDKVFKGEFLNRILT